MTEPTTDRVMPPGELELACAEAIGSFAWSDDWRNEVAAIITRVVVGPLRAEIERLKEDVRLHGLCKAELERVVSTERGIQIEFAAQRDELLAAWRKVQDTSWTDGGYRICHNGQFVASGRLFARCEAGQGGTP